MPDDLIMLMLDGGVSVALLGVLIYQMNYLNRLIEKLIDKLSEN